MAVDAFGALGSLYSPPSCDVEYNDPFGLSGTPASDSPFGAGMLDFVETQMQVAQQLSQDPNSSIFGTGGWTQTYDLPNLSYTNNWSNPNYGGPDPQGTIDNAMAYAEQFGLQDILGYPGAGGIDFFGGGGGGGGYGGYSYPAPPSDSGQPEWIIGDDYGIGGGPEGWQPFTVKDPADLDRPDVAFTMIANALSQGLSGADAWRFMADLGAFWSPQGEGGYNDPWDMYQNKGHGTQGIPGQPPHEMSLDQFALGQTGPGMVGGDWYSGDQFNRMDQALENMANVIYGDAKVGVEGLGTPYSKLREVAGVMRDANLTTRSGRQLAQASLDPILAGFTGELGAYAPLAQAIANPFFANMPGGMFAGPQRNKNIFG